MSTALQGRFLTTEPQGSPGTIFKMEPFFSSLLDLPDYHPFSVLCQLNFTYLPYWKSREIEDRKAKEALKCVSEQSLQPKLSTKHSWMLNGSLKLTQPVTCSLCKGFLKRNAPARRSPLSPPTPGIHAPPASAHIDPRAADEV